MLLLPNNSSRVGFTGIHERLTPTKVIAEGYIFSRIIPHDTPWVGGVGPT